MFPPIRMNTLFPVTPRRNGDTVESDYARFKQLSPDDINPNLANAISSHQVPVNRYAAPFTTNNLISTGINGANTSMDTVAAPSEISPLDKAKLMQGQEKINSTSDKNKNDLQFKEDKQNQDNLVRTNRAAVYKFKAENPGMKFDYSGPNIIVSDPISGKSHDTGIPTGHLSDADKINLNSTDRLNEIGQRATEQRDTNTRNNNEHSANDINAITVRGNETRKTNEAKPTNNSATQQRIGYANKARELANSNPAYAPFIKMNGNEFSITPPSEGLFGSSGPDADTYHKINEAIYGSDSSNPTKKDNKNKTKTYKPGDDPAGLNIAPNDPSLHP